MSKRNENTNWLAKLRFNSWELEILLVGFVLVVLLQVPDRIERWITITNISLSPLTNTSDFIMNVMILPVLTLSLSVVIHIMILSLIFYLILQTQSSYQVQMYLVNHYLIHPNPSLNLLNPDKIQQ